MTTIIIGAGASGLACAIRLKQNNPDCEVVILERLSEPGRKILATGNGRCNLSNADAPHSKEVVGFFNSIGLVTKVDDEGRIYPYSNQASTVLDLLVSKCEALGVELVTDCRVTEISEDLCVTTESGIYFGDSVIIATGGKAQRSLGSDGSGYELLKSLGHTINPTYPSLVQLTSPSKHPRALKGQRVKCNMKILLDGNEIKSEYGEVLFTDYGLSGIVTMNLSDVVSKNFLKPEPAKCIAELDLIPDMSLEALEEHVNNFGSLKGVLGGKMNEIIEKQTEGDKSKLAQYAKRWRLIINGTKGFDFAQITGGGASTYEFEGFRSKYNPNVYACGEVLDEQFPCGGFNLNFAWYSGICVADSISMQK